LVLPMAIWAMWRLGFFRGLGMAALLVATLTVADELLAVPKRPSIARGLFLALATAPPIVGLHFGFLWGLGAAWLQFYLVALFRATNRQSDGPPESWPPLTG